MALLYNKRITLVGQCLEPCIDGKYCCAYKTKVLPVKIYAKILEDIEWVQLTVSENFSQHQSPEIELQEASFASEKELYSKEGDRRLKIELRRLPWLSSTVESLYKILIGTQSPHSILYQRTESWGCILYQGPFVWSLMKWDASIEYLIKPSF